MNIFLGFQMRCTLFLVLLLAFHEQLGVLNVVDAMELSPEPVYPLYLVASADRYRCSFGFFFN